MAGDSEHSRQQKSQDVPRQSRAAAPQPCKPAVEGGVEVLRPDEIEGLLQRAGPTSAATEEAFISVDASPEQPLSGMIPFRFEELASASVPTQSATSDLIGDAELDVRIELGRAQMYLEDVLKLRRGSVVALDRLAGDPVDVYVNGRLVARGEVLVLNENFCVRVNELLAAQTAPLA